LIIKYVRCGTCGEAIIFKEDKLAQPYIKNGQKILMLYFKCKCGTNYQEDFYSMSNFMRRVK